MIVKTTRVVNGKGSMLINQSDFDPKIHKKYSKKTISKPPVNKEKKEEVTKPTPPRKPIARVPKVKRVQKLK